MEHIAEQAGNPRVIRELNEGFRHTWGDAGVMALNTNGYRPPAPAPGRPVTAEVIRANPVLAVTHASLGSPNNCSPPLAVFPTAAP